MNIPSDDIRAKLDESLEKTNLSALWLTDPPGCYAHGEKTVVLGLLNLTDDDEPRLELLIESFKTKTFAYRDSPHAHIMAHVDIFRRKIGGAFKTTKGVSSKWFGVDIPYWENAQGTILSYTTQPFPSLDKRLYVPDAVFRARLAEAAFLSNGALLSNGWRHYETEDVRPCMKDVIKRRFYPVFDTDNLDEWLVRPITDQEQFEIKRFKSQLKTNDFGGHSEKSSQD